MINLLLGVPGSGKSYEAVAYHVIPALKSGRLVVTNLILNLDEIEKAIPGASALVVTKLPTLDNTKPFSTMQDYRHPWRGEGGIGPLYVIDECHIPLPFKATNREVEEWYSMHRHEGADVLLITQSYGKVSKSIIELVQTVWRCRKNLALGSTNSYTRKTVDGVRGAEVSAQVRNYDRTIFPFYKSHTLSNQAVQEANTTGVKSIFFHWSFVASALFIIGGMAWVAYLYRHGFNGFMPAKSDTQITENVIPEQKPEKLKPEKPQPQKPQPKKIQGPHPLQGYGLAVAGYIQSDKRGTMYQIAVQQNGVTQFYLDHDELNKLGYTAQPITYCVVRLMRGDLDTYVVCHQATQSLASSFSSANPLPEADGGNP